MKSTAKLRPSQRTLIERRRVLKLSAHDVAERAAIDDSTYWRIESGETVSPPLDTIDSIAKALDMSTLDAFACLGWIPSNELPTIRPYLEVKYTQLPPEALYRIEGYLSAMCELYGVSFELDPHEFTEDHRAA
ncbi:helix-turn-helix domain-containing protein [Nocardia abscessus]|uniref:helix-turn-helix domain-containing protein n=1 Tax=Nocardia abscessus TaxID=120957 RepID=UPI002453C4C8|nr:helix-turn-helix transcriptional regulator [Nocardia abscessus]